MNTPLFRERRIDLLRQVRPALHPLVWVDEGAALDDENASKLHNMIVVPSMALKVGSCWVRLQNHTVFGVSGGPKVSKEQKWPKLPIIILS